MSTTGYWWQGPSSASCNRHEGHWGGAASRIWRRSSDKHLPLAPPFWTAAFAHCGTVAPGDAMDSCVVITILRGQGLDFFAALISCDDIRDVLEMVEPIEQSQLCHFTLRRARGASAISVIGLTTLIVTLQIELPTSYAPARDTRVMLHLKFLWRTPK